VLRPIIAMDKTPPELNNLPPELKDFVFGFVQEPQDVYSLRLVNREHAVRGKPFLVRA